MITKARTEPLAITEIESGLLSMNDDAAATRSSRPPAASVSEGATVDVTVDVAGRLLVENVAEGTWLEMVVALVLSALELDEDEDAELTIVAVTREDDALMPLSQ